MSDTMHPWMLAERPIEAARAEIDRLRLEVLANHDRAETFKRKANKLERNLDSTGSCDSYDRRTELLDKVIGWFDRLKPEDSTQHHLWAVSMDFTDWLDIIRQIKSELGR